MITYKGIRHNILNDAPFIGALIIAPTCKMGCKNCINQHLKENDIYYNDQASDIIEKVKTNGLNRGIILSGLEWTESPESMLQLINAALEEELKVILYTHMDEDEFFERFIVLRNRPIYIKFGKYKESLKTINNVHYGVKLATSNQYIKFCG